jgi:6-phosphofructokinase 1
MKVGVLTGGGDCPGLNAVIRAVTRCLIRQCGAEVIGIADGFAGLAEQRVRPLDWKSVDHLVAVGGTILGSTNRFDPLRSQAQITQTLASAHSLGLDALVAIGGDGTMTIAHGLAQRGLPIVGVPKTIDNDIMGCERSFGFDTAVATATEALERVHTTAQSHNRVMILETMGRHAGWIALEAGIAGSADIVLLPEIDYDLATIPGVCHERESLERFTLICMGEGCKPVGGDLTWEGSAAQGLGHRRLGGAAFALRDQLQPLLQSDVRATVLGHVQRGGPPTPFDRILATQYGIRAAELVLAGEYNRMVTLQSGQFVSIPLADVAHQNRLVTEEEPLMHAARQLGICLGEAS